MLMGKGYSRNRCPDTWVHVGYLALGARQQAGGGGERRMEEK